MRLAAFAVPVACAALVSAATPYSVSDPVGVYAAIDRVVLEPDASNPQRAQVWGVFAIADPKAGPENYAAPQRGYMYYSVNSATARATLAEWSDLQSIAGKNQVVGYGGRYEKNGRIRLANEPVRDPDTYPRSYSGLVRMPTKNPFASQITRDLMSVPLPLTPADGGTVPAGQIRLTVRSLPATDVQYVFELTRAGGNAETSPPIPAGKTETAWSSKQRLESGQNYTWRVWAVNGSWRGPAATASFRVQ